MHHLAPAPAVARPAEPGAPEGHGAIEVSGDDGVEIVKRLLATLKALEYKSNLFPGLQGDSRTHISAIDDF